MRMKIKFIRSINAAIVCAVSFALAILFIFYINTNFCVEKAYGDTQTVNNYVEAKAYLVNVRAEHDACINQANAIYKRVEEITKQAFEVQKKLTESRLNLNELAKYEYMNSTQFSIISAIIMSSNLDELFKNMDYANSVMTFQYSLVLEQMKRKAEFQTVLDELNAQNAAQNACLLEASKKLSDANSVLQSIRSKLTPEELAELEGEITDIGGGDTPGGGGGDDPTPTPTPVPPQPGPTPGPTWSSGLASAYGGSSDPSTPNPGRTATGDICDDNSMGVAIPMAWPNYSQYFHHTVQIS